MARGVRPDPKKKKPAKAAPMEPRGSIEHRNPNELRQPGGPVRVEVHLVRQPTPLVTWRSDDVFPPVSGAIVKVVPQAGLQPNEREQIKERLKREHGAAHVWFAQGAAAARTLTRRSHRPAAPQKVETVNEALDDMLKTARSANPELLRALVERFLSEAGA